MAVPITTDACDLPAPTRRWGGLVPAGLLLALGLSRLAVPDRAAAAARDAELLRGKAAQAQAEGRFADAAEYARHAAARTQGAVRAQLFCLRGESLLRDGQDEEAQRAFAEATGAGRSCAGVR